MKYRLLILILTINIFTANSQNYSSQWEGHFSYLNISGLSSNDEAIFASAENAIYSYNPNNENITTTSTIQGLSGNEISTYYYSNAFNLNIIGYENGLIEIVNDQQETTTVVDILNKPTITPDNKKINHFFEHEGIVYISCDFGITTYDLNQLEFGDTYYIGNSGAQLKVYQTTIKDNFIYAATETEGIKRADYTDSNIIDFALWNNIAPPGMINWSSIVNFSDTLYAIDSNNDIYSYDLTTFNLLSNYPSSPLDHRITGDNMLITLNNRVYVYSAPFTSVIEIPFITEYGSNFTVAELLNNTIYIGTEENGLIEFDISTSTQTNTIIPNGPSGNNHFAIKSYNTQLWVVYGDHNISYNPGGITPPDVKGVDFLKNNSWNLLSHSDVFNTRTLVDVSINPFNTEQVFVSSYFAGLLSITNDTPDILYNDTNSGLQTIASPSTQLRIGKSNFDSNGKLWLTNNLSTHPLKAYNPQDNTWETYTLEPVVSSSNPLASGQEVGYGDLIIGQNGNKWIAGYRKGVIGFSNNNSAGPIVKNLDAITGNLPTNVITGLAMDNDNNLWIGTNQGLRVLYNTSGFFSSANPQAEQVIILDDGIPKELMFGQFLTDIEVDGSNNKWLATLDSGVFYVSSNGQETIYHFTKDNSPLPSNSINDVTVDDSTGVVYFATPNGLVAFKGLSTEPSNDLSNVIVYPNPVRPEYVRESLGFDPNDIGKGIKIKGITSRVNIKITDISGKLVADSNTSTQSGNLSVSEGSYAIWNGKNFNNQIVASGVYIIMITDLDSSETTTEKVMIIK